MAAASRLRSRPGPSVIARGSGSRSAWLWAVRTHLLGIGRRRPHPAGAKSSELKSVEAMALKPWSRISPGPWPGGFGAAFSAIPAIGLSLVPGPGKRRPPSPEDPLGGSSRSAFDEAGGRRGNRGRPWWWPYGPVAGRSSDGRRRPETRRRKTPPRASTGVWVAVQLAGVALYLIIVGKQ